MLRIKNNEFVIPGQLIGSRIICDTNCFYENGKVYSAIQGIARVIGNRVIIIPSSGTYVPKEGDIVIGVVKNIMSRNWVIDINSPYTCILKGEEVARDPLNEDIRKYFVVGDIISGKISRVDEVNNSTISGPRKLENGIVIEVNPKRVPRVVGKKRSMLNLIKEKTKSRILVGQNGRIWINDGNIELTIMAIKRIEKEAQTKGLTDRIAKMLEENYNKN